MRPQLRRERIKGSFKCHGSHMYARADKLESEIFNTKRVFELPLLYSIHFRLEDATLLPLLSLFGKS